MNRAAGLFSGSAAISGDTEESRDWLYNWDSPVAQDNDRTESRRARLFIPAGTRAADRGTGGGKVARRLAISAACLALVAAGGFGWVMYSGHRQPAVAPVVAKVEQKKAPAVAAHAVASAAAKQAEVKQAEVKQVEVKAAAVAQPSRPASTPASSASKLAAVQTPAPSTIAANIPSPDSARWASGVSPSSDVTANKAPVKPAPSMTAFASAESKNPASAPSDPIAKAPDAAKPKADNSETASIPDEKDSAEKARATIEDVSHSAAAKEIDTGGSRAFVTTAAKLHSGPENRSHVLAVVPAKAAVELFNCTQWCKIAYDGHEGWIYKEFVSRSGRASSHSVSTTAHAAPVAKSKVASADSGKLIGGAVVSDGAVKSAVQAQPLAPAAAPQATPPAPAGAESETMMHNSR